jgi:hypothetical protein
LTTRLGRANLRFMVNEQVFDNADRLIMAINAFLAEVDNIDRTGFPAFITNRLNAVSASLEATERDLHANFSDMVSV